MECNSNIVLIGFMGAGKSAAAEYLSQEYGFHVVEMDKIIAGREKKSIPDIFRTCGEAYFREKETELLTELQGREHIVVSCGGGVVLKEGNITEMKKIGKVFLLTAAPRTIYERVKESKDRPVLAGRQTPEGIAELMEERKRKYEAAADVVIPTDNRTIPEVCKEIMKYV